MPKSSIHDVLEKLHPTISNDLNSKLCKVLNVGLLVLSSSSLKNLFGVNFVGWECILWFEKKNGPVSEVAG